MARRCAQMMRWAHYTHARCGHWCRSIKFLLFKGVDIFVIYCVRVDTINIITVKVKIQER